MGTFDITLPNSQRVVFPPLCVVCEKANPGETIKLSFLGVTTGSVIEMAADKALIGDVDAKYYGGNTTSRIDGIPVCKGCAAGLKWYHRFLKFGYYTGWLPGVGLIFLGLPTWISVAVCVIGACSPGILTLRFPPPFGASFMDSQANFEFKSEKVAKEFLELNSSASLKTKNKTESAASINEAQKTESK